jgi:hypothetical protein
MAGRALFRVSLLLLATSATTVFAQQAPTKTISAFGKKIPVGAARTAAASPATEIGVAARMERYLKETPIRQVNEAEQAEMAAKLVEWQKLQDERNALAARDLALRAQLASLEAAKRSEDQRFADSQKISELQQQIASLDQRLSYSEPGMSPEYFNYLMEQYPGGYRPDTGPPDWGIPQPRPQPLSENFNERWRQLTGTKAYSYPNQTPQGRVPPGSVVQAPRPVPHSESFSGRWTRLTGTRR